MTGMQKISSIMADVRKNAKPDGCYVLGTKKVANPWSGYKRERNLIAYNVADAIRDCAEGRCPWPLTMVGVTGSGKTCAALAMCDHFGGVIETMADFAMALCAVRRGESSRTLGNSVTHKIREPEFWQEWRECNLAVLDDVGGRKTISDLQYDALKLALDKRHGLPLVITTNSISHIKSTYDARIWSRLAGGTVVELEYKDRRLAR